MVFRVGRERCRCCCRARERLGGAAAAMNRFFGKAKPKAPPPSLTDCIGTVSARPGPAQRPPAWQRPQGRQRCIDRCV